MPSRGPAIVPFKPSFASKIVPTILFSLQQTGNQIFEEWARNVGLIETLEEKPEIHSHPTKISSISVDQEKIQMTM